MPAPLPISARLAAELLRRHAKGATVAELLAWLRAGRWKGKASPSGLHSWLMARGAARRYKLPKPPRPAGPTVRRNAKPARNAAIVAALAAGMRPGEAARLFGLNRRRIWAIANRAKRLAEEAAKGYSVASACEPPPAQGESPLPRSADGCDAAGSPPSSSPT